MRDGWFGRNKSMRIGADVSAASVLAIGMAFSSLHGTVAGAWELPAFTYPSQTSVYHTLVGQNIVVYNDFTNLTPGADRARLQKLDLVTGMATTLVSAAVVDGYAEGITDARSAASHYGCVAHVSPSRIFYARTKVIDGLSDLLAYQIASVPATGGTEVIWFGLTNNVSVLCVSPVGLGDGRMVFASQHDGGQEIYVQSSPGATPVLLSAFDGLSDADPVAWSNDVVWGRVANPASWLWKRDIMLSTGAQASATRELEALGTSLEQYSPAVGSSGAAWVRQPSSGVFELRFWDRASDTTSTVYTTSKRLFGSGLWGDEWYGLELISGTTYRMIKIDLSTGTKTEVGTRNVQLPVHYPGGTLSEGVPFLAYAIRPLSSLVLAPILSVDNMMPTNRVPAPEVTLRALTSPNYRLKLASSSNLVASAPEQPAEKSQVVLPRAPGSNDIWAIGVAYYSGWTNVSSLGVLNLYVTATNPPPVIMSFALTGTNTVIDFSAITGRLYDVQTASSVTGVWTNVSVGMSPPPLYNIRVTNGASGNERLYRIRAY